MWGYGKSLSQYGSGPNRSTRKSINRRVFAGNVRVFGYTAYTAIDGNVHAGKILRKVPLRR